ncbi:sterol desaturase family protein [Roseivirga sp. BDSF3-8]|uniref:sterol desaturase family protein n=1 Tax=Roseivirga sp. BDSF3-8 TaxID=3241598 RepID=UPI003531CFBC
MLTQLTQDIIYQYNWYQVWGLTIAWFLFLYFPLGYFFLRTCRRLHRKGVLTKISNRPPFPGQITYELKHSFLSIVIFGITALPLVWLLRHGAIQVLPDSPANVLYSVVVLTLWNEVHFFMIHRLMHTGWFMRHIHHVHHRSHTPTPWSVFSFHPLEAFLLSTLPLTIAPWLPLAPLGILLFPLVSIILNFAGHSNYCFGNGKTGAWLGFSSRHAGHHTGTSRSYGFALLLPDLIWNKLFNHKNH